MISLRYPNIQVNITAVTPEIGAALEAMRQDDIEIDQAML